MNTRTPSMRLVLMASVLTLGLTACAGGTADPAPDVEAPDAAGLPVDDDADTSAPTTSAMCVEDEPDCEDMIVNDGASSSCLAGDPDCTDESFGGRDVAREVPLSDAPSGAERIDRGTTTGASGAVIEAVHLLGDERLEVTFSGGACDVVEDVMVDDSSISEVRLLVLAGMADDVESCTMQLVQWSIEVDLSAPLGDRVVLDLAG